MRNIIVATIKEWNIENYFKLKDNYADKFNFHLITNNDELTFEKVQELNPKYIFFPHWSWIIKKEVYTNFECVVFHMTDLPYGRGGSPFQNLIINEVYDTKISALKVDEGLDTGAIYFKEDFNISIGSAQENFIQPFKRRKPEESNISTIDKKSINKLYDFIRMLDAEGYPKAYLNLEKIKIEFSEVHLKSKKLVGRFEVYENE